MNAHTESGRGGIGSAYPGPEPDPAQETRSSMYPTPPCPPWCSSWHCASLDDTTIHRSEPKTIRTTDGLITVCWFRIDVDDIPGTVRFEVLPDPPAEQVAA